MFKVAFRDQYALKELTNLSNAFKYIAQAGLIPATEEIPAKTRQTHLPEIKPEVKLPPEKAAETRNEIIYRIQFLSNSKPKGSYNITIGGRTYKTFEYLSNGLYKSCVGEYTSPAQANNLLAIMKKEGYPDAFVAAFENNERVREYSVQLQYLRNRQFRNRWLNLLRTQKLPEVKKQEPVKPAIEQGCTINR